MEMGQSNGKLAPFSLSLALSTQLQHQYQAMYAYVSGVANNLTVLCSLKFFLCMEPFRYATILNTQPCYQYLEISLWPWPFFG